MTKFAPIFVKAIYAILIVGLFASCDGYQKLIKNGTPEEKLTAAKEYYNNEKYLKAQPLFEELINLYYGRPEREEIYYYYAYTHYGLGEFLLAGYHFKNYAETYTLSPKREECTYMTAVCDYHKSLSPELDQTSTKSAISRMQSFINQYPNSTYVPEANERIDELRKRLLVKAYESAKLYYHLGYYKSAIIACNNALDDYPDIINREELNYLIVASNYEYAKGSIEAKQTARYQETLQSVKTYYKEYPRGIYYDEVARIKEKAETQIEEISSTN